MALTPTDLTTNAQTFLTDRHLGTLSTVHADGRPHVVAIAFMYDHEERLVRVICTEGGQKVKNIERTGRAAVCQVDGPRWLSLEGPASITRDPGRIAEAVARYEERYVPARINPQRVAIEIDVERILGQA